MNTSAVSVDPQDPPATYPEDRVSSLMAAEHAFEPSALPALAPGRVRTVSYRRLKNLGNFENEVVEVEGFVFGSENPAVVLDELRHWVFSQLNISAVEFDSRKRELLELDDQLWALKDQRDSLRANIEAMRSWAAKHGTTFMAELSEPLPF